MLAGCASAAARERGLSGSLGATYLAAGAHQVLAALWSIDDEATHRFITRFYREGGASAPIAALARTQRALMATEPVSAWAPFVLLGAEPTDQ